MNDYKHWQLATGNDDILWLSLDRADVPVNALNHEVMGELKQILTELAQRPPRGLIIESAKSSGFIAGADIKEFGDIKTANDAIGVAREGQKLFDQLEALPCPTVALVKGFCMGGGTELILACDYRVACDDDKTVLGLPEVKLGIHPGWGGSVRLPRLIGAMQAMGVILTGRALRARAAAKIGMIDVAVPERHLKTAARDMILNKRAKHQPTLLQRLSNTAICRPALASLFNKQLAKKSVCAHYPGPFAVVKNWRTDGVNGEAAMITEANSMGDLLVTPSSRHLVRVFFLQEKMKGLAKGITYQAQHVHVIGAGAMGGDIAAWCALKGYNVTLQDREAKMIAPAIKRAHQLYKKKCKKPRAIEIAMDRLMPDVNGDGIKKADIIIEAIFEDLSVKQELFKRLEAEAKPDAILASNTSSIPLDDISSVMDNPKRLVGIHFFNPVAMMPLVEVVKGKKTAKAVLDHSVKFVTQLGKQPIVVKSHPGFLVNRCLMPYMMEAITLLDEGVSGVAIDQAARDFGMPMGPIELGDAVGLDICLSVATNLSQAFGGTVPESLASIVKQGKLGKKTGQGYYAWKKGKPIKGKVTTPAPRDAIKRLIGRMINECAACLREDIIGDKDLLDAGMIFGTGFAPFRGGPLQYADDRGFSNIETELQDLANKYGERFTPDSYWQQATVVATADTAEPVS